MGDRTSNKLSEEIVGSIPDLLKFCHQLKSIAHFQSKVSFLQFRILVKISRLPMINLKDLAKNLNVSASTISPVIRELACLGWVQSKTDPTDKRRIRLMITQNGEKYLVNFENILVDYWNRIFLKFSPKELDRFMNALRVIVEFTRDRRLGD